MQIPTMTVMVAKMPERIQMTTMIAFLMPLMIVLPVISVGPLMPIPTMILMVAKILMKTLTTIMMVLKMYLMIVQSVS